MISGIRDFGVTLGGKIGKILFGLFTQSLLAWNLGPGGRGSLAVCLVFSSVLYIVFSIACDIAALYFVASRKFSLSEGIIYTLIYGIITSTVAIVMGLILLRLPLAFFEQASAANFRLALLFIPVSLLATVLPNLLTAVRQFQLFALVTILSSFFQLVYTILFVWWLDWGVRGALWASILTGITIIIISMVIFWKKYDLQWVRPSPTKLKAMFAYGARYYLGKLSNKMNLQIGPVILAFFATRAEIGWFAIAARLTQLVEMIPETMTTVLIPRSSGDREGRSRLVARSARVTGIVSGLALLTLAILAQPIITVIFSPAFLPAVPFIRILAIGLSVRCMGKVFVAYLIGTDHPGYGSIAVTAGVAVNIGVMWYLLPRVGVIGAPWGMTISYFISSAILVVSFSRLSGLNLRKIFSFRRTDWSEMKNFFLSLRKKTALSRR